MKVVVAAVEATTAIKNSFIKKLIKDQNNWNWKK